MNNQSVKHHYLPRHYLRGFTDDNDGFFVYDKQKDKIFRSSSGATFFENNLNTMVSPQGATSDWLEEFYAEVENSVWRSFDIIRDSTNTTPIDISDKMKLFFFLLFLHWRIPSNIKTVEKLSEGAFREDNDILNFMTFADKDGNKAPDAIIELIRSSSDFKKAMRVLLW